MSVESIASLIGGGTGATAVLVIFLTLLLAGKLHTDDEFSRMSDALDKEKEAHEETRRALALAGERADAAVKASELIADAFSASSRRRARDALEP